MLAKIDIADPYYRRGDVIDRTKVEELLNNSPYIKKADTFEELGREIGVENLESFLADITDYNNCFDKSLEKDPKFGKSLKLSKKFDTPPYYAIQIFPLARKNFGGVKTDLHCRVLSKYFEPIPGLYAAGEVAGMAGGHINGKAGLGSRQIKKPFHKETIARRKIDTLISPLLQLCQEPDRKCIVE